MISKKMKRIQADHKRIKKQLLQLAEPEFQKFESSLIPNIPSGKILGVRLLNLRKIAKTIIKSDWETYLKNALDDSFEEVMLQGMVIGYLKEEPEKILHYASCFIPKIDNWSVCDSFCSGLKLAKTHPEEVWDFLKPYLSSKEEYKQRFGIVMLLLYFTEEKYREAAFEVLGNMNSSFYYVRMAAAWAVSVYYIKYPKETIEFLKKGKLDDFTYQKALQKITESKKIKPEAREMIREMKKRKPFAINNLLNTNVCSDKLKSEKR